MIFKKTLICCLFLLPVFSGTQAQELKPHVLGAIIRPRMVDKLLSIFQSQIPVQGCVGDDQHRWSLDFQLSFEAAPLQWIADDDKILALRSTISNFIFFGKFAPGCPAKETDYVPFNASITDSFPLEIRIQPQGSLLNFEIDKASWVLALKSLKLNTREDSPLNSILNLKSVQESIFLLIKDKVDESISKWLLGKMRDFAFAESITDLIRKNRVWSSGVDVQDGAIKLENLSPRITERELAFLLYPRKAENIFISNRQLELYSNTLFLNQNQITEQIAEPLNPYTQSTRIGKLQQSVSSYKNLGESEFQRPLIGKRNSDFSLLVSDKLINDALQSIYAQDLLEFVAQIDIGSQVAGILTSIRPDIGIRVALGSSSVPKIAFDANKLKLSVDDYYLSLGTYVEDRLIPSTKIQASVNVSAQLEVDSKTQMVNLNIDADTFQISLSESGNKLKAEDLRLMERLATDVWKSFFRKYPKLLLFPTMFEDHSGRMSVQIDNIELWKDLILIHCNLEKGSQQ